MAGKRLDAADLRFPITGVLPAQSLKFGIGPVMIGSLRHTTPPAPARPDLGAFSAPNFGLVMATGIVSLAANMLGAPILARVLFVLNIAAYAVLWLLTVLRFIFHRNRLVRDVVDHLTGPGFFTIVAATSVLGSQCVMLASSYFWAEVLWAVASVLWIGLTYTVFALFTIKEEKPRLDEGINGGWLLAVVATQSITVLSALLAAHLEQPHKLEMNFLALSMWLWGGMLYIWMMSLIFYRYTFFRFSPADLSPPYWINMGAMAISTLGGSLLIINAPDAPFLLSILPFLKGFTVFYWATGTWWIPMLVVLALWRHAYKRFPLHYDPLYWGAVFPLGMYAASTHKMIEALSLDFLSAIPGFFLYCALAAWAATMTGLLLVLRQRIAAALGIGRA